MNAAEALDDTHARLTRLLVRSRNPDGGWGYRAGRQSRLEPTCWATLALTAGAPDGDTSRDAWASAWRLFQSWQGRDGLLAEHGLPPNPGFNGLAALVLLAAVPPVPGNEGLWPRLRAGLLSSFGVQRAESAFVRQDNNLRGWPWVAETFSWVEPTSWCLLALKKGIRAGGAGAADRARIVEAERLLFDRRCTSSGWNHGNSNALGKQLDPYVPTTAAALLALQDRQDHPGVREALAYLERSWADEQSGLGTGLSALCLSCYGRSDARLYQALEAAEQKTAFVEDLLSLSIATYALVTADARPRALAL